MECLFCRIVKGDIPSQKVYEDELVLAFRDIAPQAKKHILVIPKVHIDSLNEASLAEDALLAHLIRVAAKVANLEGITDSGYRLVSNCGPHACQSVQHLHFHVIGGEQLSGQMV